MVEDATAVTQRGKQSKPKTADSRWSFRLL